MNFKFSNYWMMSTCFALIMAAGILPQVVTAADPALPAEKERPIPFKMPVVGMRGVADDRGRVSGLALTEEDMGWPSLTMLGNPFSIIGALGKSTDHPYEALGPMPVSFGTVRMGEGGHLTDQQVNEITNTLTFLNDHNEALKVTLTRLSPAILLEADSKELELFGENNNLTNTKDSGNTVWDEAHQKMVSLPPEQRGPFAPGRFPPPAGLVKPLRWAVPRADGTVLTGVLGSQPSLSFPFIDWHKRFVPAPSSAPAKSSMPPAAGLGQHWLLLWYGSGSPFLSSKVPAVLTGGLHFYVLSPAAMETVYHADVPLLLVFEKSPQSIGLRLDGNTNRLIVNSKDQVGKVVMLPLFGHNIPAAETTEKWLKEFPKELKAHCDGWAKRLGDFPVNVKEETTYNEKNDQITTTETFEYIKIRPGGMKMVLVRPMLALGLQQKLPAIVTPKPVDLKYATQFGPLMAVSDDHYQWQIHGIGKYVNGSPVIGPVNVKSAELEQELSAEVDKVLAAGHLAPWVTGAGALFSDTDFVYGKDPSEVFYVLAEILPLLPEAQQVKVRDYLTHEMAIYPPDTMLQLKVGEGTRREFIIVPPSYPQRFDWPLGTSSASDEYYENDLSLFRAYSISRYYRATGQQPSQKILEFWRQKMRESLADREWDTMGWFWGKYAVNRGNAKKVAESQYTKTCRGCYSQHTLRAVHRDIAGLIGYLRLCQLSHQKGEPEAWGQLAQLLAFRYALAGYGRYLAESGLFRMPGAPEAAPYTCIAAMLSSPNRSINHAVAGEELARSGDFSKPENHVEQIGEVNQHEVAMYYGASKYVTGWYFGFNNPILSDMSYQNTFYDLTPEAGHLLADWGMKDNAAHYLKHYAEIQPVWYKAHAENIQFCTGERASIMPTDAYQLFLAHAWITGTPPAILERYIDEPWVAIGDYFYMHKLAETIKAYRGIKWESVK